jgi:HAD superfamily hydrolase (TIGR01509 family)
MPIARSLFAEVKKLRVFDFDDTLVKTDSHVYVKHSSGKETKLTPGQFAVHTLKSGDTYDFRDFDAVINPTEIKAITKVLRGMIKGSGDRGVFILTARAAWKPIEDYLRDIGINGVHVVALGSSNPKDKADWIEKQIDSEGYDDVYFIDDSKKNVDAVKSMLQKKGVKHRVQLMKHKG